VSDATDNCVASDKTEQIASEDCTGEHTDADEDMVRGRSAEHQSEHSYLAGAEARYVNLKCHTVKNEASIVKAREYQI
jgi:hypothetical protein